MALFHQVNTNLTPIKVHISLKYLLLNFKLFLHTRSDRMHLAMLAVVLFDSLLNPNLQLILLHFNLILNSAIISSICWFCSACEMFFQSCFVKLWWLRCRFVVSAQLTITLMHILSRFHPHTISGLFQLKFLLLLLD